MGSENICDYEMENMTKKFQIVSDSVEIGKNLNLNKKKKNLIEFLILNQT